MCTTGMGQIPRSSYWIELTLCGIYRWNKAPDLSSRLPLLCYLQVSDALRLRQSILVRKLWIFTAGVERPSSLTSLSWQIHSWRSKSNTLLHIAGCHRKRNWVSYAGQDKISGRNDSLGPAHQWGAGLQYWVSRMMAVEHLRTTYNYQPWMAA